MRFPLTFQRRKGGSGSVPVIGGSQDAAPVSTPPSAKADNILFCGLRDVNGWPIQRIAICWTLETNSYTLAAAGTAPPAVTLSGTTSGRPAVTIEIDITLTGIRGVATFQWLLNGVVQQTGQLTAATFALGTTGLTANFPAGTYTNDNVYTSSPTVPTAFNVDAYFWEAATGRWYKINDTALSVKPNQLFFFDTVTIVLHHQSTGVARAARWDGDLHRRHGPGCPGERHVLVRGGRRPDDCRDVSPACRPPASLE
jgi:hypothetical protein